MPALTASAAASRLLDDVDTGRFTRPEVDAVLTAAGQATRPAIVARPAGLTEREVDVLRLIARGRSNKRVAATLGAVSWRLTQRCVPAIGDAGSPDRRASNEG
jgi:DNA-binding NarL/FixJ family response regulator